MFQTLDRPSKLHHSKARIPVGELEQLLHRMLVHDADGGRGVPISSSASSTIGLSTSLEIVEWNTLYLLNAGYLLHSGDPNM